MRAGRLASSETAAWWAALLLAFVAAITPVQAQWRPSKTIELVVMAGKGGGADKAARLLAGMIEEAGLADAGLRVVNMPGQHGAEALVHLDGQRDNDHLLLFTLNSFYTLPMDRPELKLDIARFAPIALMGEDSFLLWVHAERRDIRTLDDFVKAARRKGEGWVMAGTGLGAEDSLLTEFLNVTFGLKMRYAPFDGGGEVARELAEQRADSTVNNPSEQAEHYPAGRTRPVASFTPQRLGAFRRTATLRESGVDFSYHTQRAIAGPPGMSGPAQAYYGALFRRVFDMPQWQAYRRTNELRGGFLGGRDLAAYWLAEREKHERLKLTFDAMR